MGLKDEINADIAQAFDMDLADAVKEFVATRHIQNDDDWAMNDNTGTQTEYKGRGVFGGYHAYEIDGQNVMATDIKLICLQSELTDTPQIDDLIDGKRVLAISKDPADVSFVLQLRAV